MDHLFEFESPYDLFREVQAAINEYDNEPNNRLLLFLLFSLNHLREWIAGIGYQELRNKNKRGHELSEAEKFCLAIDTISKECNKTSTPSTVKTGLSTEAANNAELSRLLRRTKGRTTRRR